MSDNISIKFNDKAFRSAMKKAPVEVGREVSNALLKTAKETNNKIKGALKIDWHGTLRQSVKVDDISPFEKRVGPHANYARFVEEGTKPGYWPKFEPINDWVKGRLGIKDDKEAARVTEGIRWKINAFGTKARPFVQPVVDSGFPQRRLNQLANKGVSIGLRKAGL